MMRYINEPENLKIMMNLLRGNTKAIQFEAFHVFKIFVANPKKSQPVVEILVRNRKKLIEFLQKFQKDKGGCGCMDACVLSNRCMWCWMSMPCAVV